MDVRPWRAYTVSAWIRTEGCHPTQAICFCVQGEKGRWLFKNRTCGLGRSPPAGTADWAKVTIHFNSLEEQRARIWVMANRITGTVWFDDLSVEEVGLYRTIRRPSVPVRVASRDGRRVYDEGEDYLVKDGKLVIPQGSRLDAGDELAVSWYQQANVENWWYAPTAFVGEKPYAILEDNSRRLDSLFDGPPGFMMAYDEDAAALLARCVLDVPVSGGATSTDLLRRVHPAFAEELDFRTEDEEAAADGG